MDAAAGKRAATKPLDGRDFIASSKVMIDASPSPLIAYDDFSRVDIRVGTVIVAEPFPEARKPALKLQIDFGPVIGVKKSSAQITRHYIAETLIGTQVVAVINFPPRQIGPMRSEVLTLGVPDEQGEVVLLRPTRAVPNGGKMF
jgi:tRNA-binding protein